MDQDALVREQIDAGRRFLDAFGQLEPVKFAAWLREVESGRWYLYVISDSINDQDVPRAYDYVVQIVKKMSIPRLDPFRIRIVGANTARASQVLGLQQLAATTTTPAPWHQTAVSGIDDAHVYSTGATKQ
jgi:hypothetical protein